MNRRDRLLRRSMREATPLALAVIALTAASSCAMPEPPARVALVYGVSVYDIRYAEGVDGTNNLSYTDNDASDFATLFKDKGWLVHERIANTQSAIENSDTTRASIEADIASLAGTQGQVLFYFSGHGVLIDNVSYIVPFGSIEDTSQLISSKDLNSMFEKAGIHNAIFIIDTCNSGGFVFEGATADAVPPIFGVYDTDGDIQYKYFIDATSNSIRKFMSYSSSSKYITISAAGKNELSWETDEIQHGLFTYSLLEVANNPLSDMDGDGLICTSELYYSTCYVMDIVWNTPNKKVFDYYIKQYRDYHPHLSGTAREYALWAAQ